MQFSYLAVFFLFFINLFAFILLAPFHLSLNVGKKGPLVEGSIKLLWLGWTIMKAEISPQPADELLASILKEEAGKEEQAVEERKTNGEEKAGEKKKNEIDNPTDNQKAGALRPPSIQSLVNAPPALAKILRDLLKSIHFKKSSCRLCFGLDDPAQTAIISGYLWLLASALGFFPAKILIEPWFEGERLEGELVAEIEARLLWAVFAVINIMRVREIRLLLREMLRWS
ncbi:MAG: DUF2953 domain-containing protein [Methanothrix sp.]|jgi:hypothetical protein|nr:DUF2953 domain-containing protein [Methanothrix sp.]